LPDEAWARRDSGVFSNELANNYPARPHTALTDKSNVNFLISIQATLNINYFDNECSGQVKIDTLILQFSHLTSLTYR
jgi:hypothetical protein